MKGNELLKEQIGKTLKDGKIQSFELRGELIELITVTFLKFEDWIKIVSTDEQTIISPIDEEFQNTIKYDNEEFKYPIAKIENYFPEFKKYIGQQLIAVKELVGLKNPQFSFGINLYFDNGLNFIIHNQDYPMDKNEFIFENKVPINLIEK
jgi:hypothetical protein